LRYQSETCPEAAASRRPASRTGIARANNGH
jgi:hypothetical protein